MSCFGGREEQIFLVEFTVERLKLTAERYSEEFADSPPVIKLKFVDFPVFVITRRSRDLKGMCEDEDQEKDDEKDEEPPPPPYDENVGLIYASGKSCLFVKKPRDLVGAMQKQPLRIGIFRDEETFPIAEACVPLTGCLCDQVAMANNNSENKPKPYEQCGEYNLADPGGNPSGTIKIYVRLTLFGSYIISHYELYDDNCIFKNEYDGELRVTKVEDEDDMEEFKIDEGTVLAAIRAEVNGQDSESSSVDCV